MIINSLKSRQSSLRPISRLFSSQVIKTTNDLNTNEKQNSVKTEETQKKDLSLTKDELDQLGKSEYMERIWELNLRYSHKQEYNKITDLAYEVHKPLKDKLDPILFPKPLTWNRFREGYRDWKQYREENRNKYVSKRHSILGPDLAVANFVVERGGRVRFRHSPDVWATHLSHFPDKYDRRYQVIAVDASHTNLLFEGIDNFVELNCLQSLNLSDNRLDDWSCDKIGRMFRSSSLSTLDLSNNRLITHRGIETLHRIRSLKCLKISGTEAAKYPFIELLVISFNDLVPNCEIVYK